MIFYSILFYSILYSIKLYYIILYYIILYYIILYYIILYYIILYYIILYYIILYYITLTRCRHLDYLFHCPPLNDDIKTIVYDHFKQRRRVVNDVKCCDVSRVVT